MRGTSSVRQSHRLVQKLNTVYYRKIYSIRDASRVARYPLAFESASERTALGLKNDSTADDNAFLGMIFKRSGQLTRADRLGSIAEKRI
jgi:hypothetical protein